jgi:hypothetical protein
MSAIMYQLCPGGAFLGTCEPTSFPQLRRAQEPALREAVCVLSGGMRQRVVGAIAMAGGGRS